ncbi:FAD-dependent oxidoreductase [Mesorhizobium sp. CU2]|uniref:oxidoreductase n=1 Tax=unclassified Mesorhizobium TaxID=325217 RepID=UPI00112E42A4|nr:MULTISPECIES: FAD-dependent oxidoreductase [unclassified Mesorhizobium]TPN81136.1 FAD-dependent oxidoreductase [Mesorhizobium sp. CU3]TPO17065.1 FAD-dependent oxidoreductase [Mesorhizobium sp. CU2]
MSEASISQLLTPLQIGNVRLKNRMVFTAHDTALQEKGMVTDAYIAYQVARTRGGAGLQILAAASIDENSATYEHQIQLFTDESIPGFRRMAEAVHAEGGVVFGQLLHSGRAATYSLDGSAPVTYSSSNLMSERHHIVPRAMSLADIKSVIRSYAAAAKRVQFAGLDGVEICGSHGYLPAQFLTQGVNNRTDEYGGSAENRFRFILEVCEAIRHAVGIGYVVGIRLSAADLDNVGLDADDALDMMRRLEKAALVDYYHLVVGGASTKSGTIHVVPPMALAAGYVTPFGEKAKKVLKAPVIVTGRFNTPQVAELAVRRGAADAVGMTRAMICDPLVAKKIQERRLDDIRACIGCDQACIGHMQRGYSVSCIQYPESGRETSLAIYPPAALRKRVLVAGGGPAGMKAAVVAAARGHDVILCEAGGQLGGQANLAAKIPGRSEFGGIVTNLSREVQLAGIEVRMRTRVTRNLLESMAVDALVIATGGKPAAFDPTRFEGMTTIVAADVLSGAVKAGQRVVVADSMCDWVGIGVSLQLASEGHEVTLAITGVQPGEMVPLYVRDEAAGRLFDAGVRVVNYARLYGADEDNVYFEHIMAMKPLVLEGIDTLVLCDGARADRTLETEVAGLNIETYLAGDCLTPRTAEEAVLEGLKVGRRI